MTSKPFSFTKWFEIGETEYGVSVTEVYPGSDFECKISPVVKVFPGEETISFDTFVSLSGMTKDMVLSEMEYDTSIAYSEALYLKRTIESVREG